MQPRKHKRYPLKALMIVSWRDAEATLQQAIGLTRDICMKGAFVLIPNPPPLGANVKFEGFLPPAHGAAHNLRMHGQGHVVRVEPAPDAKMRGGFAMAGNPFVLRRRKDISTAKTTLLLRLILWPFYVVWRAIFSLQGAETKCLSRQPKQSG